jgi:putative ABC transport system permease protein
MRWLRQTFAVTWLNLRTIPQRLGSSSVAIVGIAGVVVVLVAVGLGGPETEIIKQAPGILRAGDAPVASAELFVIVDLPKISTGTPANVPLRGIEPMAPRVRPEVSIVEGRMLEFGTNEVVVGRAASGQFSGLTVGSEIRSGQFTWNVVGMFEADGSVAETEIWCDARTLQSAYRRGNSYQSVLVHLDSPASFDTFKDWLTSNPQVNVSVRRETEYYAAQSATLSTVIRTIGYGIAGLMAIGAVFGAILTMYTAVASRSREIATLRALGFNWIAVLVSVLAESLALAALGGVLGGVLAYVGFNGYQTSTINFQTFSQVAFAFRVTPALLATGLIWALAMGLLGGLFPAVRAARLPISRALREW